MVKQVEKTASSEPKEHKPDKWLYRLIEHVSHKIEDITFANLTPEDLSSLLWGSAKDILGIVAECAGEKLDFSSLYRKRKIKVLKKFTKPVDIEFILEEVNEKVIGLLTTAEILFLVSEFIDEDTFIPDVFNIKAQKAADKLNPVIVQKYFDTISNKKKSGKKYERELYSEFDVQLEEITLKNGIAEDELYCELFAKWVDGSLNVEKKHDQAFSEELLGAKKLAISCLYSLLIWKTYSTPEAEQMFCDKIGKMRKRQKKLLMIHNAVHDTNINNPSDLKRYSNFQIEFSERALKIVSLKLLEAVKKYRAASVDIQILIDYWRGSGEKPLGEDSLKKLECKVDRTRDLVVETSVLKEWLRDTGGNKDFTHMLWQVLSPAVFNLDYLFDDRKLKATYEKIYSKPIFKHSFECLREANEEMRRLK